MGHDSQVPRELPVELRERSNGLPTLSDKAQQSSDVLANWWAVYGQIYRDDPTDVLLVSFQEILSPLLLKPEILHQALLIAARQSPEFRPKPGRVYEIAETLMERQQQIGNRPKYLDEPKMSEQERQEVLQDAEYIELRQKITGKAIG
jgi:hypothetical protein